MKQKFGSNPCMDDGADTTISKFKCLQSIMTVHKQYRD